MDKETNKIHKNLSPCNEQTYPTVQNKTQIYLITAQPFYQ